MRSPGRLPGGNQGDWWREPPEQWEKHRDFDRQTSGCMVSSYIKLVAETCVKDSRRMEEFHMSLRSVHVSVRHVVMGAAWRTTLNLYMFIMVHNSG